MAYDMSFMSNSTTLWEGLSGINTATNFMYATMFLVMLWVAIAVMAEYTMVKSMILASFITMIIASFLAFMQWVTWSVAVWPFIIMCVGIAVYFWSDEK